LPRTRFEDAGAAAMKVPQFERLRFGGFVADCAGR
jgi:hypothetical protein